VKTVLKLGLVLVVLLVATSALGQAGTVAAGESGLTVGQWIAIAVSTSTVLGTIGGLLERLPPTSRWHSLGVLLASLGTDLASLVKLLPGQGP